jgi:hypothetical protein
MQAAKLDAKSLLSPNQLACWKGSEMLAVLNPQDAVNGAKSNTNYIFIQLATGRDPMTQETRFSSNEHCAKIRPLLKQFPMVHYDRTNGGKQWGKDCIFLRKRPYFERELVGGCGRGISKSPVTVQWSSAQVLIKQLLPRGVTDLFQQDKVNTFPQRVSCC